MSEHDLSPALALKAANFIRQHTRRMAPSILPEMELYLTNEVQPIWQATEIWLAEQNCPPPYWAFAWPGGQALARYILDKPEIVRGKKVFELACGAGQAAIAAARSGALIVKAMDIDAMARMAASLNAAINNVSLSVETDTGFMHEAEIILAGDIFYERQNSLNLLAQLRAEKARGALVLLGDPERSYFPHQECEALAAYAVPVPMDLEDVPIKRTGVWRLI